MYNLPIYFLILVMFFTVLRLFAMMKAYFRDKPYEYTITRDVVPLAVILQTCILVSLGYVLWLVYYS